MTTRLRLIEFWLLAAIALVGIGVLADRSPKTAFAAAIIFTLAALALQVDHLPATWIFCGAVVLSSALVDLPGRVHFGRFSANAGLTVAYAVLGVLVVTFSPRLAPEASRPLRPFIGLFLFGLLSIGWGAPSVAAIQNLLVLLVFIACTACGIAIAAVEPVPGRFATTVFGLGSSIALALYAASLAAGGIGSGTAIGSRTFALFGLVAIAWGSAGWRYHARFGRALTLVTGLFILLSLSRTAFAAALIMGCLAWLNPRSVRGWFQSIAGVGAAVGIGYFAVHHIQALHDRIYTGDVRSIGGGLSVNVSGRFQFWATTWHSYRTSPYFGHGVGTADDLISKVYSTGVGHPHNDYLRILHDYGLFGMCLWAIGYAWLLRRSWRSWQNTPTDLMDGRPGRSDARRIHAAAFLSLVGVAIAMITDNVIDYMFVMAPLGVLVGLSMGLGLRSARQEATIGRSWKYQRAIGRTTGSMIATPRDQAGAEPPGSEPRGIRRLHAASAVDAGSSALQTGFVSLRTLVRSFGLNLFGGIASAALTFGFTLLMTHVLSAAGVGIFFQVIAIFSILIVLPQLGASATIVKTVSEYRVLGRTRDIPRGLGVAVIPVAALALVMAIAVFVFAPALASALVKHGNRHDAIVYLRVVAPFIPAAALFPILLAVTRALATMVPTVALDSILKPGLRFLLAIAATLIALSPAALGVLWAAPLGLGFVLAAYAVIRRTGQTRPARGESLPPTSIRRLLQEFWTFTTPQWLAEVFQLGVLWIDVVLVGALASSKEAGIYAAVSRLVTIGAVGLAALVLVLAPVLSGLLGNGELRRVRALYGLATVWLSIASVPVFLVMATFAPVLVRIFGHGFRPGASALAILSIAMMVDVVTGPAMLTLLMGGRSDLTFADTGIGFLANIGLNIALIPRFGMTGAAVAWSASILIVSALALVQLYRLWGIRLFNTAFGAVIALATVCYGVGGLVSIRLGGQNILTLVTFTAFATIVYVASLHRFRTRFALGSLIAAAYTDVG